ncbi:hypothetical protein DPMN_015008 [Dreissena polymorpha]|uniref:Uncharacterized protein n=1 Tax=Dreissena polymorpha TaxID=45954 RepID=A0A9D4NAF6_DREPO|nr:hypothetical protein DPMN_015008 [Dreissena polymorpha]
MFSLNTYRENCPAPWRPCFFTDLDYFQLVRDINKTNVLTKFHDDWAKIVTSRVFTRNTAPPPGGHCSQGIIGTNVLTKFHEDRTINVASRVFTRQMLTTDVRRTKVNHKSLP